METQVRDLWPNDIGVLDTDFLTPVGILREQASRLGEKTKNIVEARVSTSKNGPTLIHTFTLVAPAMDNYQYALLGVSHPAFELYPVNIQYFPTNAGLAARAQDEFLERLGQYLSTEKTRNIIQSLIAQSQK
ncbi:MAG: hypothetical protein ACKV2V_27965 [Blastocatellia bacterium]